MARTESKSLTCHPNDEQEVINTMQKFHWSLIGSQDVKTVDNYLEESWSGDIRSVSNTEHYTKLTFSREIDLPNLNEIKKLERDYFALSSPHYPKLFPIHIGLWGVLTLFYGAGIILWLLYFFEYYKPKTEEAQKITELNAQQRQRILSEVEKFY